MAERTRAEAFVSERSRLRAAASAALVALFLSEEGQGMGRQWRRKIRGGSFIRRQRRGAGR